MAGNDWDKEMKRIDKQLESISDDALISTPGAKAPAEKARATEVKSSTSTFGVFARLMLAALLGLGMLFWPYSVRCGPGLFAYLFASAMVTVGGVWTAIWTWRHRSAQAHVLSLLLVVWGLVLAGIEVLPRVGYAIPTASHPATWTCS
ncbi:MAG: hypothetical protein JJD97_03815 [Gemmatimonadaceae bacterium]|nr:hypothetical protein [Gemmatimonadaceae bacterium]